ncbi:MAG: ribose-5-phosphate isomerase RpiA [Thermoproteota archaeon]|nr:ribose-5-phosphate isomerase RpiA [Thermoproteota archaeon]MDQ3888828.1 ribose-5-phosphate isomerase RpiA [Thermoproteota archaeon]
MSFQDSIQKLAKEAVKLVKGIKVVGLGSGRTVGFIVREMAKLSNKESIEFIPTSLQIKLEAEKYSLKIADESMIPHTDIVFDGADQIDGKFNMIKGGGGALLREKILISAAKKVVIVADAPKFVQYFSRPVPIEVHPLARSVLSKKLAQMGGQPVLRTLDKGYPLVTENGNLILDTFFPSMTDPKKMEVELKNIAGVLEVGLFTRRADIYYRAKDDGSFETISFQ